MNQKPNFLTKVYPLRVSDFDKNNRVLPSAVLDIFQDAAGAHATKLGINGIDLLRDGRCWMLTRVRYDVLKQPALYQDLVVKTWPVESKRIELDRDFLIYDENDELLIRGSSQWVVMDISDRESPKLVPARDFEFGLDEYVTERSFERAFPRAVYGEIVSENPYPCRSEYSDLDMNDHVNNIKYAKFALNAVATELTASSEISAFRIDFSKEVRAGELLNVHYKRVENSDGTIDLICRGETEATPSNFTVKFTVKN